MSLILKHLRKAAWCACFLNKRALDRAAGRVLKFWALGFVLFD